jgi:transcriptional regulator with XRE-family HTH domain
MPKLIPAAVPAAAAELYARGLSLRQTAARVGLTHEGVRQILMRRGVALRSRGVSRGVETSTPALSRIAARLHGLRAAAGVSQGQLAARSGLHPATVNGLERGRHRPTRATLEKLAGGLGVGLEALGVRRWERP